MTTTTHADELLPCPFCGHTGLTFGDGSTYRWGVATCEECGASAGETRREYPDSGKWHTDARAQWNRRAPQPRIDATDIPPLLRYSPSGKDVMSLDNSGSYCRYGVATEHVTAARMAALDDAANAAMQVGGKEGTDDAQKATAWMCASAIRDLKSDRGDTQEAR